MADVRVRMQVPCLGAALSRPEDGRARGDHQIHSDGPVARGVPTGKACDSCIRAKARECIAHTHAGAQPILHRRACQGPEVSLQLPVTVAPHSGRPALFPILGTRDTACTVSSLVFICAHRCGCSGFSLG